MADETTPEQTPELPDPTPPPPDLTAPAPQPAPSSGERSTGELGPGERSTGVLATGGGRPGELGTGKSTTDPVPDHDRADPTHDPENDDDRPDPAAPDGPGAGKAESPARVGPGKLRRDTEHRLLGGVAAGVARYLDVDPVFVRVAFAVLTVLGGSGALIYLAAWLLIPADDEEHPLVQQWAGRRPARRSLVLIVIGVVVGVIALSDLFSNGPWRPHPYGGFGVVLGALALVVALSLVAGSGGSRTASSRLRWFSLMLVLALVGMVVVAAATVFSIEAASGVPLRGGIGDTQVHPTTTGQLASNYRLAVGNLTVDLTDVPFRAGTTRVTTSVGIGRLVVEVPPGPTVSVVAHSGLGDVQVFGQDNSGFSTVQTTEAAGTGRWSRRHLVLTADAGVGQVEVVRMAPAFS